MVITNMEAFALQDSINKILAENITLSAKTSYKLLSNLRALEGIVKMVSDVRSKVFYKYAQARDDGEMVVPEESIASANIELQELSEVCQEVNLLTISIDELTDKEISIQIINGLMPIIEPLG